MLGALGLIIPAMAVTASAFSSELKIQTEATTIDVTVPGQNSPENIVNTKQIIPSIAKTKKTISLALPSNHSTSSLPKLLVH